MADRGNKIMLVSSSFTKTLEDTLKFDCTYSYFRSVDLKKYAASLLKRDSIYWIGDPEVYSRQVFRFYPQFCKSYFRRYDSLPVRKLAEVNLASGRGTHWMNWILRPFPAIIIRWWLWFVRGERVKSFWFLLLCFLPITECWMRKMRLTYSASCRRWENCLLSAPKIYEGNCTDAAISFALFSVAKAASLGDLSVDVRYLALYGVYSTEAATGNTCHTGTGKQIP